MIDVSVIIVNWNTRDMLLQCIDSFISQSEAYTMEIIVVDNASIDGSTRAVKKRFPEVIVIQNKENLGFAKANNIGITNAKGRYLCFSNSDIQVLPGAVYKMVAYMDENLNIGLLGPKTLNSDYSLRKNCRVFPNLWNTFTLSFGLQNIFPNSKLFSGTLMSYFSHEEILQVDVLPGCFWLVRRDALETVGLLDERFFIYGEDVDWCRSFWNNDWKVVFYPFSQVIHFAQVSSSKAPLRFHLERVKANAAYWNKYSRGIKLRLYYFLMLFHFKLRLFGSLLALCLLPQDREKHVIVFRSSASSIRWLFTQLIKIKT